MKTRFIFLSAILFCSISFGQITQQTDRVSHQLLNDESNGIINQIVAKLNKLDNFYLKKLKFKDYQKSREIVDEIFDLLNAIPLVDKKPEIPPMSDVDFAQLIKNLQDETFEDDKLSVLSLAAKFNNFTVKQLINIISEFTYSSGKLRAVEIIYPYIVDKWNSHQIINSFTYSSDKEKVRRIIESF
ncbi:MAG: DUF4476 domain-containing protein [Ignavibacteriaceae bacterium]|nr:DUF4476 domain-containing protein [Ignavibacteriaceae bacterium]